MIAAEAASADATDLKGVPKVIAELTGFPYQFGPDFLHAVLEKEGEPGRNRLFTDRPTAEEHILAADLPQPAEAAGGEGSALAEGEKVVEDSEDDVGMLSLLVMLAERIDFGVSWRAVQRWAGDSIVAFERGGTTCVRAEVVFDEPTQAERFAGAFDQWATGRPAKHTRSDRSVVFESCDPGAAAVGSAAEIQPVQIQSEA